MNKTNSISWFLVALLFSVISVVLLMSDMVIHPGHTILQMGGDSGKNYFTFLYHSVYDKGIWFQGMNYPYGEHIIYADGQPLLSTLLNRFFRVSVSGALAIMNLLIGLSYVLAIVFTWKILQRFGVKPFVAILFACLINLCAPQVLRLKAHFALAYICPIPMLFYWTILYHGSRQLKYIMYIFILGLIVSFTHLYMGAMFMMWAAFYTLGCLIFLRSSFSRRFMQALPLLVTGVALFVIIKAAVALTDPLRDRPSFPLNDLEYVTRRKDIVTSSFSPFWQAFRHAKWYKVVADGAEGHTYLGIAAILAIVISLAAEIVNRLKKKTTYHSVISDEGFSPLWLFMGLCSLVLAMGIPFIWHMQWLLEYLSLFKQFRAMGRFSWMFYYVAVIYAAVVINSWYARNVAGGRRFAGYALLSCLMVIWAIEAGGYITDMHRYIKNGLPVADRFFEKVQWQPFLEEHHYRPADFQAIMLLPFFACGSEKLWVCIDPNLQLSIGMQASLQMHLPIVDIMMSRSSWSITERQVKTAGGPLTEKPMLHDLPSMKPFLLIQPYAAGLDDDQQYLLKASDFIGNFGEGHVYACYPARILANDKRVADSISALLPGIHTGDTCLAFKGEWYVNHYDTMRGAQPFFGMGAWLPLDREDTVFATIPIKPLYDNQPYEFSCWFLVSDKDYRSPYIHINQLDDRDSLTKWCDDAAVKFSVDNHGMWFRAAEYFTMKASCRAIRCTLLNKPMPTYLSMDEMQIRPVDATIISKSADGKVLVNNHLFRTR
jgi:hypothetical protein